MKKKKIAKRHLRSDLVSRCLYSSVSKFTKELLKKEENQILRYFYNSSLHIYRVETNKNGCKNCFTAWGYFFQVCDYEGYAFYHIKSGKISIFERSEVKIIEEIFGSFFIGKRFFEFHLENGGYYKEC